jgi:hypothetical protein
MPSEFFGRVAFVSERGLKVFGIVLFFWKAGKSK